MDRELIIPCSWTLTLKRGGPIIMRFLPNMQLASDAVAP